MVLDPLLAFGDRAEEMMIAALTALGTETRLPVELPPEGMGDFAFPCFPLARELKKSPAEIAKSIAASLGTDAMFCKIEPSGPYVNFHIEPEELVRVTVESIMELRENYGNAESSGIKINLEHTSANPNGPLHVGRARNPIIGDTLARILRRCGHDVTTEFYVDDMGKQQVTLTWGVENLVQEGEIPEKADHALVWYYQEASRRMEQDPKVLAEIDAIISKYEDRDPEIATRVQTNCQRVLDGMTQSLRRLDINFDSFAWESKYIFDGSVERIIEQLRAMECTSEDNGALYLDLDNFGISGKENKFFLTRGDGSSLYSTRDMAYHLDKLANYDRAIDVLGEDHKLKAKVVGIGVNLLGQEKPVEPVFYSFVSLPEGKMSTRRGRVVYLDDLVEESIALAREEVEKRRPELDDVLKRGIADAVGIGAIRYNIIRIQAEKQLIFKWEEAMNFEGNSAPFIQYSHARASSILRKATEFGDYDLKLLAHPSEVQLAKMLARFPSVIRTCGTDMACHPVAAYAFELAAMFNQFYRDCPVLVAEEKLKNARLAMVTASKLVLMNALDTLGIVAPEEL
ncbi:MAG: arginine--tRNA ligase [Candidatus Thermoplasmatota archaeon]|nr:arginine--tRNA ligase [Euryarchaeota archaeon]MBU4032122.1 arginine--tRNA ligase [Candidatus Thermoplasmatota archaeon]MBU4070648.1 arginine--tRNA ligase [Candidatus Thermoplasmatota archaeon]MBU4145143.1 arginine--tRNA ligase [Candidatus Thermoplasmatota archaeon]MBU4591593.1 arginine--tRNA ligase [Candidatus Thermoplasmatota archaeon]